MSECKMEKVSILYNRQIYYFNKYRYNTLTFKYLDILLYLIQYSGQGIKIYWQKTLSLSAADTGYL